MSELTNNNEVNGFDLDYIIRLELLDIGKLLEELEKLSIDENDPKDVLMKYLSSKYNFKYMGNDFDSNNEELKQLIYDKFNQEIDLGLNYLEKRIDNSNSLKNKIIKKKNQRKRN